MTDKLTPQQAIQKIYDEGRQVVRWNVIKMLTDSGLVVGARANFCDKCGGKCVPDYDDENGSYECEFCFWQRVAEAKSDQVNTLTAENAVLKAEVERLKADKERIDWIEDLLQAGVLSTGMELDGGIYLDVSGFINAEEVSYRERNSFREAIDEARQALGLEVSDGE